MKKCYLVMLASLFMFSQFGLCGSAKKTSGSLMAIPIKRNIVYFSNDDVPIPIKRTKDILIKKGTKTNAISQKK